MKKRLLPLIILVVYIIILLKVMVFKDVPLVRIGSLMLNFGGTDASHPANFIPFKTIVPYLFGYKGWIIAGINLAGNILLLVPIGFLVPYVYQKFTWKKSLFLAIVSGLVIETMQVVLRVGIFDIDDVILNAFGVMIGYWAFVAFAKMKYRNMLIATTVGIVMLLFVAVPIRLERAVVHTESEVSQSADLCGGTGGNGVVVSVGNNSFTIRKKDGADMVISLRVQAAINTPAGSGSLADLKTGDKVTLVGDPNVGGGFDADAVFVCS